MTAALAHLALSLIVTGVGAIMVRHPGAIARQPLPVATALVALIGAGVGRYLAWLFSADPWPFVVAATTFLLAAWTVACVHDAIVDRRQARR